MWTTTHDATGPSTAPTPQGKSVAKHGPLPLISIGLACESDIKNVSGYCPIRCSKKCRWTEKSQGAD